MIDGMLMRAIEVWNCVPKPRATDEFVGRIFDRALEARVREGSVLLPIGDENGVYDDDFVLADWEGTPQTFTSHYKLRCPMVVRMTPSRPYMHWAIIMSGGNPAALTPPLSVYTRTTDALVGHVGLKTEQSQRTPGAVFGDPNDGSKGREDITVLRGVARVSVSVPVYIGIGVGGVTSREIRVHRTALALSSVPDLAP